MNHTNDKKSAIIFPTKYPLKVMGMNTEEFRRVIRAIVEKQVKGRIVFAEQPSAGGKYISVTATFTAESKEQLDAIYRELHGTKLVLMTL
jgi:uncharacterized protein